MKAFEREIVKIQKKVLARKFADLILSIMAGVILFHLIAFIAGCTSTTINIPPGAKVGNITVNANKTVTTSPSLKADGNTVPVSPLP